MIKIFTLLFLVLIPNIVSAQSLTGTRTAVKNAYEQALEHNFSFLDNAKQQATFLQNDLLVKLTGNAHYELHQVSRPYVRPEVKLFVERLAKQYYRDCGRKLVVTSALRFVSERPRNGSRESVHPTGMAIDIRSTVSLIGKDCHEWLRRNLLVTEDRDITEVTLERNPPHFHVVIFPQQYQCYVAKRTGGTCQTTIKPKKGMERIRPHGRSPAPRISLRPQMRLKRVAVQRPKKRPD